MDWGQGGRLAFSFDPVCDLRRQQHKSPHPINPSITVCPSTVKPRGQVVIKKKNKVAGQGQAPAEKAAQESILPSDFTVKKKKKISILGVPHSQKIQDGTVRCA